jgi:flagellum-specific ATP synthase
MTDLELKPTGFDTARYLEALEHSPIYAPAGKVAKSVGMVFEAHLPGARVGSLCRIESAVGDVQAEVVGFRDKRVMLMPFDDATGINNESRIRLEQESSSFRVGMGLLGRVIDARGNPMDGRGPLMADDEGELRSLYQKPSHPLERAVIRKPLDLGVRAINALLTCGRGQRVGIMAGSGVGKSVLLGMMARHTAADVNVIALIGERGREVREFIERDLGPEGLARSVVVVATSDQSPLLRMRGAFLASTIAEYFRDRCGKDVLLMMDSVTRFCMAQREIGLSMGEPPASKGYTPSVFSTLPKLLERAGTGIAGGSITGLYTVLVEGDDMDDPIADSARSILDGHIVLSRKIAQRNHFPAIDVLQSASRVMRSVISPEHNDWSGRIREWMATYQQVEDLLNLGAYQRGSNPRIDTAIRVHDRIDQLLRQGIDEGASLDETLAGMRAIVLAADAAAQAGA